ncbi:hypothetical protein RUND412_006312 [Rhizina undulata]
MKASWLDKICSHYEHIAAILQQNKTFNPPYISESGGKVHRFQKEKDSDSDTGGDAGEFDAKDAEDPHPPIRRQKIPSTPAAKEGHKGIKKERGTTADQTLAAIAEK